MEVKPGYKQTEVGIIPEDWKRECIRDAAANTANSIVGGPFGSDLVSADYSSAGVPVIRGQNMAAKFVGGEFVFVPPSKAKSLGPNLAYPNDLIFTQRGTLGQVSIVPNDAFDSYLISQSQMKVSLDGRRHDPNFVYQYFESHAGQKQIITSAIQTGVPHTNLGILREYQFPAPSLPEQRAIASALSDVDALLSGLDRLIAKKRHLKQAAIQQLLTGQTRLPGFEGEWRGGVIGDVVEALEAGVSVNSTDEPPTSVTASVLKTSAVSAGRLIPEECKRITSADVVRAQLNPRANTILISRMNTPDLVGDVAYVPVDYPWLFLPDRLWMTRFKPGVQIDVRWLAYLLSSRAYQQQIKAAATGTSGSMKNISKGSLLGIPVLFPEQQEQSAIAAVLSDMDAELTALEARREKTRLLKLGMMQELLTGKTRLIPPEPANA